jgi:hypothetical protein
MGKDRQTESNGLFKGYEQAKRTKNYELLFYLLLFIFECYLHNILKSSSCVKASTVIPFKETKPVSVVSGNDQSHVKHKYAEVADTFNVKAADAPLCCKGLII